MDFYTNVAVINDTILYRGFDGGERVERREEFSPTLYVPSKKETEYKTLEGNYVDCLLYTSPSPRDGLLSRMPSSA